MTLTCTVGFLGFGNMGRAIAGGLLERGTIAPKHLAVYDVDVDKQTQARELGLTVCADPAELGRVSNVVMLAVKPQSMDDALQALAPAVSSKTLVISIAAGISLEYIANRLGRDCRAIRVMPNTPALVNAGAAGIAVGPNCTAEDSRVAQTIFEAVGTVELVPESSIDVVTALSGSGPAYFFYMVECLVAAAKQHGLSEQQATRLAAQTLLGAGLLLRESGETAETLRERVTSKGGTTEAALNVFHERGLCDTVEEAVAAAIRRAKELGQ